MRIVTPPGSPSWVAQVLEQINRAFTALDWPRIRTVANAAAKPPAKDNEGRAIFVRDIKRVAVSDGANWIRQDTGASL